MKHFLGLSLAALALSACSGNPIAVYGPDDGDNGVVTPPIEGEDSCGTSSFVCSGDLEAVSYNEDTDVLTITNTPFDETPDGGSFVRADLVDNSGLGFDLNVDNVNGFAAYENDDPDRINPYLAYIQTSDDGSVTVGQVRVTGGYRTFGYGGAFYRRNSNDEVPSNELATYSGDYAGIVALSGDKFEAGEVYTSEGGVFFEVDFTDGLIKGQTVGRTINGGVAEDSTELVFDDTAFTTANTYAGNATSVGSDPNWTGGYQGIFGGNEGSTTGGTFVVTRDSFDGDNELTAQEVGTFIATKN